LNASKELPEGVPENNVASSIALFQRIISLKLVYWIAKKAPRAGDDWSAVAIFDALAKRMPVINKVEFEDSEVTGQSLIRILRSRINEEQKPPLTVVFNSCTGVTQSDCEEMINSNPKLVDKLSAWV
jgi:hypothetical protein